MSKIIIAGPWNGELGWLLMKWQPIFRAMKYKNPNDKIIMSGNSDHRVLYEDYCDEFIETESVTGDTDGWKVNGKTHHIEKAKLKYYKNYRYISPSVSGIVNNNKLKFIEYKKTVDAPKSDIIIHARYTDKCNTNYRNWTANKWEKLYKKLLHQGLNVISIGRTGQALCYGTNMLDVPIRKVISLMKSSKLIVGPSSGPMHLASLCGLDHIVFTDNKFQPSCNGTNKDRYEKIWNPLGTSCEVLDQHNWQPPVELVYSKIAEHLNT